MPKFLEKKLKTEASAKGMSGRTTDRYVYGAMNNMGAMHGNKETAKGARMDAKHARDEKAGTASDQHPARNLGAHLHPKGSGGKPWTAYQRPKRSR